LLSLNKMKEKGMPIFVYNIDETSNKSSERMKGNKYSPDTPFRLL
ncbi:9934_t:CDS:1, partial [Scutellospora calospora]